MRVRLLLTLLVSACVETASATPDADLDTGVESVRDAGGDSADAPEDASAQDDAAEGDIDGGSFLSMPAFDDAAVPDGCNRVLNDAPQVDVQYVPEALPEAGGGVIADGVYERVAVRQYTGNSGDAGALESAQRAVLWLTEGAFHFSQSSAGRPNDHLSGTFAQEGTQLTLTRTCPLPVQTSPFDRFEASERELIFYSSSLQRAIVYRRR